jgi:hypothetical protein
MSHSTLARITNVTIERHECVLPLVAKKKVVAAVTLVSSQEAFTVGLALQLEVPTAVANILGVKVREECWNSGLYDRLEAVMTSIHLEVVVASIQLEATENNGVMLPKP